MYTYIQLNRKQKQRLLDIIEMAEHRDNKKYNYTFDICQNDELGEYGRMRLEKDFCWSLYHLTGAVLANKGKIIIDNIDDWNESEDVINMATVTGMIENKFIGEHDIAELIVEHRERAGEFVLPETYESHPTKFYTTHYEFVNEPESMINWYNPLVAIEIGDFFIKLMYRDGAEFRTNRFHVDVELLSSLLEKWKDFGPFISEKSPSKCC